MSNANIYTRTEGAQKINTTSNKYPETKSPVAEVVNVPKLGWLRYFDSQAYLKNMSIIWYAAKCREGVIVGRDKPARIEANWAKNGRYPLSILSGAAREAGRSEHQSQYGKDDGAGGKRPPRQETPLSGLTAAGTGHFDWSFCSLYF